MMNTIEILLYMSSNSEIVELVDEWKHITSTNLVGDLYKGILLRHIDIAINFLKNERNFSYKEANNGNS